MPGAARRVMGAIVAISMGHLITNLIPDSMYASYMAQTSLALMAIVSLAVMVMLQHRREGYLMSQTQEELLLIATLGLFWFAIRIAFRAMNYSGSRARATTVDIRNARNRPPVPQAAYPFPCSRSDPYCTVVEEWEIFDW